jgi:hypothetical protein
VAGCFEEDMKPPISIESCEFIHKLIDTRLLNKGAASWT